MSLLEDASGKSYPCIENQPTLKSLKSLDVMSLELCFEEDKQDPISSEDTNHFTNLKGGTSPKTFTSENLSSEIKADNMNTFEDGEVSENADMEDGEIRDAITNDEYLEKYTCRHHQKGRCAFGKECRYLHLSDRGLYSMFDSPATYKRVHLVEVPSSPDRGFQLTEEIEETKETAWDQALKEAKERIRQSIVRKRESSHHEKLYMTIEKNDEVVCMESPQTTSRNFFKSPIRKSTGHYFFQNGTKKLRNADDDSLRPEPTGSCCLNRSTYKSEWRDPWRRSKTPERSKKLLSRSTSDTSSSNSRDNSGSSSRECKRNFSSKKHRHRKHSRSRFVRRNARKISPHRHGHRYSRSCKSDSPPSSSSSSSSFHIPKRSSKQDCVCQKGSKKEVKVHSMSPITENRNPEKEVMNEKSLSTDRSSLNRRESTPKHVVRKQTISSRQEQGSRHLTCSPVHSSPMISRADLPSPGRSCSDMSISPYSDSSLSAIFDPVKQRSPRDNLRQCRSVITIPHVSDWLETFGKEFLPGSQTAHSGGKADTQKCLRSKENSVQSLKITLKSGPGDKKNFEKCQRSKQIPVQCVNITPKSGPINKSHYEKCLISKQNPVQFKMTTPKCGPVDKTNAEKWLRSSQNAVQSEKITPKSGPEIISNPKTLVRHGGRGMTAKKKKVGALERQLLKYQDTRKSFDKPCSSTAVADAAAKSAVSDTRHKGDTISTSSIKCAHEKKAELHKSKPSKKEVLLKRLEDINAAIKRKRLKQLF